MVRAPGAARLRERQELRRLVDRVRLARRGSRRDGLTSKGLRSSRSPPDLSPGANPTHPIDFRTYLPTRDRGVKGESAVVISQEEHLKELDKGYRFDWK